MVDFEKLKNKRKTSISITVDTDNLEFLKEDMKMAGVGDMPLSKVFDGMLEDFVDFRKKIREKKLEEKNNQTKPTEEEDGESKEEK